MLNTVIVGASGYAGAELAALVQNHPELKLFGLYVSAGSQDAHKRFSSLHPQWVGELDQPLLPLDEDGMTRILTQADLVLLATAHEVSAELAPKFLAKGLPVFCAATGHVAPLQVLVMPIGGRLIDGEDVKLLEWAKAYHATRALKKRMRRIEEELG